MDTPYLHIIPENLSFFDMEEEGLQEAVARALAEALSDNGQEEQQPFAS